MTDDASPVKVLTITHTKPGWITVRLDGEVVYRRFTRDPAFTRLWVCWSGNGSPVRYTRRDYRSTVLGGAWRPKYRGYGSIQGGVEHLLPAQGETHEWHRHPDPPKTRDRPFPNPGGWYRPSAHYVDHPLPPLGP